MEKLPPISELNITVTSGLLKPVEPETEFPMEHFLKIRDYLWHHGEQCNALTMDQAVELYKLGDGYGTLTDEDLVERELMWDWSHIRDSTPAAQKLIYARLLDFLPSP